MIATLLPTGSLTLHIENHRGERCRENLTLELGHRPNGLGAPVCKQSQRTQTGSVTFENVPVHVPLQVRISTEAGIRGPLITDIPALQAICMEATARVRLRAPLPQVLVHVMDERGTPLAAGTRLRISLVPARRAGLAGCMRNRTLCIAADGLLRVPIEAWGHLDVP